MDNCNIIGTIDFGKGPVDVRCSKVGPHERHKFDDPEEDLTPVVKHKNVFDKEE